MFLACHNVAHKSEAIARKEGMKKQPRKQHKWTPPPKKTLAAPSDADVDSQTVLGDELSIESSTTGIKDVYKINLREHPGLAEKIERKVGSLIVAIRLAISTLAEQENELTAIQLSHWSCAKTRYTAKNQFGATLSMQKVKKSQLQLDKVLKAKDYLQTQEVNLAEKVREAQTLGLVRDGWEYDVDWKRYAVRVLEIMQQTGVEERRSDEELLDELSQAFLLEAA